MITTETLKSDVIDFPADRILLLAGGTCKNKFAIALMATAAALTAVATILSMIGGAAGLGIAGLLLVIAVVLLRQRYYEAGLDVGRQEVTVMSANLLRMRRQTLPFDVIQWLDFERGQEGAALCLKDGSMLRLAGPPSDYAELDRRLAEVRTRTGLPAAPVGLAHADTSLSVATDATGWVTIKSLRSSVIPRLIPGVTILLLAAIGIAGAVAFFSTQPLPHSFDGWFAFCATLAATPLMIFVGAGGVYMLLGPPPKVLLDPVSRQLHVEGGFLRPRRERTIAFEEIKSAGVVHGRDRDGECFIPYLKLRSEQIVHLYLLGDDFRSCNEVAEFVRQTTGAVRKNIG